MRLSIFLGIIMVLCSFTLYGCTSCGCDSCSPETESDVAGDKETLPEKNTVDSCETGETIECANGGQRECDCSGSYCLWTPCKT